MTKQQRRVLIAVGAATLLLALVVGVVSRSGSHRKVAVKPVSRSTTTAAPVTTADPRVPTTVDLLPVPNSPVTTAAAPHAVVPTTTPPPTTTTAAPPVTLSGQGAVMTPPATSDHRTGTPDDCSTLVDSGWDANCGLVHVTGGDLLWMVEHQAVGASVAWRAYILRQVGTGRWDVTLVAKDDRGLAFTSVQVGVADVVGDGGQEAIFGFHYQYPANALVIDVVQPPGRVGLHRLYLNGSVVPVTSELTGWWQAPGETTYGHEVLRYLSGAWRIISSIRTTPSAVPASAV